MHLAIPEICQPETYRATLVQSIISLIKFIFKNCTKNAVGILGSLIDRIRKHLYIADI